MPPINPYSAGGMVQDPAMFFGRDEELKRIRDRLRKGDSTAVVGLRRIGKSSLLYQLAHQTDALPDGVVAVYLDLQEATHHQPVSLLNAAWQGLNQQLGRRDDSPSIENLADFSTRVKQMAAEGLRPVLCLDEVEELTDRPAFDDDFFEGLRSLGNQRALAFVTASGESLDVLLKRTNRTSPFYNLFINLELAGLSDEAARTLLTKPFRAAGLNPPPDDYVAEVLDLAGHYPFYLQMAAYHLFEARASGGVLNRLALREAFTRDAERHFRGLWRHLSAVDEIIRLTRCQPMLVQLMGSLLVDWLNSPVRRQQGDWLSATMDDVAHAADEILSVGHSAYFANLWADAGDDGQRVLWAVAQAPDGLSPSELTQKAGLAADDLLAVLTRLEQYRLVEPSRDRWRVQVELTRRAFARFAKSA